MIESRRSHSICSIGYHLIWCTKYRRKVLEGSAKEFLKKVFEEICRRYDWQLESIEVMEDHVHLFVQADHLTAPVDIAKTLKSISATRFFSAFPKVKQHSFWRSGLWSKGTYYSTVGHISEGTVRRYIENQKERGSSGRSHPRPRGARSSRSV